jgi:hypothetical protein
MPSQPDKISGRQSLSCAQCRANPVTGLAVTTELRFELEILIIYKSSKHRKKLAVKQVPVTGLAVATELRFELEI